MNSAETQKQTHLYVHTLSMTEVNHEKRKYFSIIELDQWVILINENVTPSAHHSQNLFPGKLKPQL